MTMNMCFEIYRGQIKLSYVILSDKYRLLFTKNNNKKRNG